MRTRLAPCAWAARATAEPSTPKAPVMTMTRPAMRTPGNGNGRGFPRPLLESRFRRRTLEALDDRHVGQAAAFAHGLQAVALAAGLQRVEQRGHQLGARGAQRVAQGDRAAVDVEVVGIGAGLL